jgi:thiopurine S-methyltransferase
MDPQFWKAAWTEGRTAFHNLDVNEKLKTYFPRLEPKEGQRVLVPLCGKSKDLLWLENQRLQVHGVELHEPAVQAFFTENQLPSPDKTQDPHFTHYSQGNLVISCGDFFKLDEPAAYDLIYDRAALVALPKDMRKDYAQTLKRSLKPAGKCLLIVYEYDQTRMEGPPFSVDSAEIQALYQDRFTIELLEAKRPIHESPRLAAVEKLEEKVYLLQAR